MGVEKKKMNLSGGKFDKSKSSAQPKKVRDEEDNKTVDTSGNADNAADGDEDEDVFAGVSEKSNSKNNLLFALLAVGIVVICALVFLLFAGGKDSEEDTNTQKLDQGYYEQYEPTTQSNNQQNQNTNVEQQPQTPATPNLGTQDFTGNTNMTTSDILVNPDKYTEDIYGLTTRVDYTVKQISYIADFVSYEKYRGTWGGGIELYWLDVEYKNNKYVVQVPFKYYKELDDVGIIPVKMEVLTIEGSAANETLTVISYMTLDEETLKNILKQQSK